MILIHIVCSFSMALWRDFSAGLNSWVMELSCQHCRNMFVPYCIHLLTSTLKWVIVALKRRLFQKLAPLMARNLIPSLGLLFGCQLSQTEKGHLLRVVIPMKLKVYKGFVTNCKFHWGRDLGRSLCPASSPKADPVLLKWFLTHILKLF